jgi:hypothetical protein
MPSGLTLWASWSLAFFLGVFCYEGPDLNQTVKCLSCVQSNMPKMITPRGKEKTRNQWSYKTDGCLGQIFLNRECASEGQKQTGRVC